MVSLKATVMVITLLAVCLLAQDTSAQLGCCRRYATRKIPFRQIRGYSVQLATEMCPFSAIIFHSNGGQKACANPAHTWVIDYVNRLGNEAYLVHVKSSKQKI